MKTKPITIEPGSGTKFAGKRVVLREYVGKKSAVWEIIYVGASSFMAKNTMFQNEDICKLYQKNEWFEVLPDDLPQDTPKKTPVHELFFNEFGDCDLQFFDLELTKHNSPIKRLKTEELYQVFKSRLIAELGVGACNSITDKTKLKSDNLI